MQVAIIEAAKGMTNNDGGPFGAVVVKNGKIVSKAHNEVIKSNDPTSHAEILAIRKAAKKLKRFDLSDCEIYSTCEPCPMCLGAIYWAKIKILYFGCNKEDTVNIQFDDAFIYEDITSKSGKKRLSMFQLERDECLTLFETWKKKADKVQY